MSYPRFEGTPSASPPRPAPAPAPAPAAAPDPTSVASFEDLVALGIGPTTAFFESHRGHYERLRAAYFNRVATPASRPVSSR